MHLDFLDILSNLIGLFMLIAVGYLAARCNVVPVSASPIFSKLLMKVTLPCTIFTSLLRPYDPAFIKDILVTIVLSFLIFPLTSLVAPLLARAFRVPVGRRGAWAFCVAYVNNGFMGFPIAMALFGERGVALTAIFGLPFNLIQYTVGASLMASDQAATSGKRLPMDLRSKILTVINLAAVLGLIFYFARLSVPTMVLTPLTHLSNITTPLSMFVTGLNLANGSFRDVFRNRHILTACLSRLVLMPLMCFAVLSCLNLAGSLIGALVFGAVFINCAMPSPAVATIMAETYGADKSFAAGIVFMTSLLCILTIPVMALML